MWISNLPPTLLFWRGFQSTPEPWQRDPLLPWHLHTSSTKEMEWVRVPPIKGNMEENIPSQKRRTQCRGVTMLRQHFFMHDSLTSNSSGTSSVESSAGWILVLFFFLLNILGSPVGYAISGFANLKSQAIEILTTSETVRAGTTCSIDRRSFSHLHSYRYPYSTCTGSYHTVLLLHSTVP